MCVIYSDDDDGDDDDKKDFHVCARFVTNKREGGTVQERLPCIREAS